MNNKIIENILISAILIIFLILNNQNNRYELTNWFMRKCSFKQITIIIEDEKSMDVLYDKWIFVKKYKTLENLFNEVIDDYPTKKVILHENNQVLLKYNPILI
jgi:hypothetical protein